MVDKYYKTCIPYIIAKYGISTIISILLFWTNAQFGVIAQTLQHQFHTFLCSISFPIPPFPFLSLISIITYNLQPFFL